MKKVYRKMLAVIFSAIFHGISLLLVIVTLHSFVMTIYTDGTAELIAVLLRAINTLIIALAMFELGTVVVKEYGGDEDGNIYRDVRRTITRFVGTVTIALVLEGLIMIIKYSQLDMAGNLIYPILIITAAALLLVALGAFLALSKSSGLPHGGDSAV